MKRTLSLAARACCLVGGMFFAPGCADPVQSDAQASLGPEAPGVSRGPLHRPGQPCLVCHDGGRAPTFTVAGTLFVTPGSAQPLVGGSVTIVDASGASYSTTSNCAGNFFVRSQDFTPTYPFHTSIAYKGDSVPMNSYVHRDGSCASCHTDPPGPASAGRIFLTDLPNPPTVPGCP